MLDEKWYALIAGLLYMFVIGLLIFLRELVDFPYAIAAMVIAFFAAFFIVLPNAPFKPDRLPDALSYFISGILIMGMALVMVNQFLNSSQYGDNALKTPILTVVAGVLFFAGTYLILNSVFGEGLGEFVIEEKPPRREGKTEQKEEEKLNFLDKL